MSEKEKRQELAQIVESASRLGIELDEEEALQWLTAIAVAQDGQDISVDVKSGVFGHKVTMLDFSQEELAHFRRVGEIVGFPDQPGRVETALALSGSAAQSKIQRYPGDADFFERINIIADTKEEACGILAEVMRKKVEETHKGETFEMIEVKFGSYQQDVKKNDKLNQAGSPISWRPSEVLAGKMDLQTAGGEPLTITWEDASRDPGWCKLDWVVADPVHEVLVNASNMLDVTWEAPDGSILPLDGYLDPYFQEVYLEAESIPLFTKLAKHVSPDALEDYVHALEKEVKKYVSKDLNYGKAARRMYNIFRLTGRYEAAAYLRELFDEPTTVLYRVSSLIRTVDDTFTADPHFTKEELIDHMDKLITNVIEALEGEEEVEVVRLLMRLRDILFKEEAGRELSPQAEAARAELINIVNNFFYEKLTAIPIIKGYMDEVTEAA